MSYLVLARKYRPQTFAEVIGQEHVTTTLANAFSQDRVHHAFLFCGPRGCGKTTTARILGKALNCEHGPTSAPCGTCEACVSIAGGTAVDYFEMDGASNRGIDAIRDLTDAVRYQPAILRKKVYVIDEVHMLTTEAFNALLKTLEEPPPHVTFVMATTEPHKVPNTILSRCQRFDFKLVPRARLAEHIASTFKREEIAIDPGAINLLVRESGGSVRDALSLCDQVISYVGTEEISESRVADVLGVADRSLTRTLVQALSAGDARTSLEAADAAIARGVDEVQLARAIVRYLRDLAVAQAAPGSKSLIEGSDDERAEIEELATNLETSRVRQMFDRMLHTCDDLGRTEQPRLVLDLGLIDLASVEPMVPLGDLLERLGAMERRVGRGGAGGPGAGGPGAGTGGKKASAPAQAAPAQAAPAQAAQAPAPAQAQAAQAPAPAQAAAPPAPAQAAPAQAAPAQAAQAGNPGPGIKSTDPLAAWEEVMTALNDAKEFGLMTIYQTAKVLAWENDSIRVGFSADGLTAEIASSTEKIARMKDFLIQKVGRPVTFNVKLLSPEEEANAKSVIEAANQRASEQKILRREEAEGHPMTKTVLKTFGATIKEIKVNV